MQSEIAASAGAGTERLQTDLDAVAWAARRYRRRLLTLGVLVFAAMAVGRMLGVFPLPFWLSGGAVVLGVLAARQLCRPAVAAVRWRVRRRARMGIPDDRHTWTLQAVRRQRSEDLWAAAGEGVSAAVVLGSAWGLLLLSGLADGPAVLGVRLQEADGVWLPGMLLVPLAPLFAVLHLLGVRWLVAAVAALVQALRAMPARRALLVRLPSHATAVELVWRVVREQWGARPPTGPAEERDVLAVHEVGVKCRGRAAVRLCRLGRREADQWWDVLVTAAPRARRETVRRRSLFL